ncbi:MAG: hypothetical protein V3G42_01365 [Oscillospiraceae bacterium]
MIQFRKDNAKNYQGIPFLLELHDNPDNELSLKIALPTIGEPLTEDALVNSPAKVGEILKKSIPIEPDETQIYQIVFPSYITYLMRNESYCSLDPYEVKEGTHFTIYTKSRLLDTLQTFTDCQTLSDGTLYPYPWKHYGIITNNHVIDVISGDEPIITKINT